MKRIIVFSTFLLFILSTSAQVDLTQFANLYPDCIDNEPSKIYSPEEPFLILPEFPGCKDMGNTTEGCKRQMMYYIYQNTEYPDVFDASGVQIKGVVLVRAVIDRCGVVKLPKVIQSLSDLQDGEALRVIQSFPLMKPAEIDGERVKVALTIPVSFNRTIKPKEQKKKYDSDEFWNNWDNWDY